MMFHLRRAVRLLVRWTRRSLRRLSMCGWTALLFEGRARRSRASLLCADGLQTESRTASPASSIRFANASIHSRESADSAGASGWNDGRAMP